MIPFVASAHWFARVIDNYLVGVERGQSITILSSPIAAIHRSTHLRDDHQTLAPNATDFRQLMGLFTTGVCVVSVETSDQNLAAMTINSFVSVSLDPMLVCWSLQNSASQFDLFAKADRFAFSILGSTQADIAQRYAARGDTLLR